MGGMGRCTARGETVVVRPNITRGPPARACGHHQSGRRGGNRSPLRGRWRRSVVGTDVSCNEAEACFERRGIATAASAAGAEMVLPQQPFFKRVDLKGQMLGEWLMLEPFVTPAGSSTSPSRSTTA